MKTKEKLLRKYDGNTFIKALVQLVPNGMGSGLDKIFSDRLELIKQERANCFFEELAKGKITIDQSFLENEDFLHAYFSTASYALKTRRRKKIKLFARLLSNSFYQTELNSIDEYEDLLTILDNLSYREIITLDILAKYSSTPKLDEHNDLQWTQTFWDDFEKELCSVININENEVTSYMDKITRTGCYEMFTGGYFDYTGGKGKLTPIYFKLRKFTKESS